MEHIKGGVAAVGFLTGPADENIQKIIKKTIRTSDSFSIVKFEHILWCTVWYLFYCPWYKLSEIEIAKRPQTDSLCHL